MTDKLSIPAKEEQDLHIAKHIEPDSLPAIIQPVMALAQTDAEKDMLLLALLTAAGSCMPNLYFCKPVEFALTADQRTRLGQHLENAYPMLMQLLGQNFHSVVLRMAVQIERIAMILSALRHAGEQLRIKNYELRMECSDTDYATEELIGNKLLLHMASAYRLINGAEFFSAG